MDYVGKGEECFAGFEEAVLYGVVERCFGGSHARKEVVTFWIHWSFLAERALFEVEGWG